VSPSAHTAIDAQTTEFFYKHLDLANAALRLRIPFSLSLPALWAAALISLDPVVRHGLSVARQREPA
jgi:hypothetical protein